MKRLIAILAFVLLASPAMAQMPQQQQQDYPALALQLNNVVSNWAMMLAAKDRQIADLQKQVADLKAKYEPNAKK